jgi:hypothetical protein
LHQDVDVDPCIAYFAEDTTNEQLGFELVARVSREFWHIEPTPGRVPEGPHFNYEDGPELFCQRPGRGPLNIVWDTNLLIDYFQHGHAMWSPDAEWLSHRVPGTHGEELEALQVVMALWVVRDIRCHVLPRTLTDARSKLSDSRLRDRERAFSRFASAIAYVGGPEQDPGPPGGLELPPRALERILCRIPAGGDRDLVAASLRAGMHVFLTMDKRVLRETAALRTLGLRLASPGDLLEMLAESGALHCLVDPQKYLRWPAPDQARVHELLEALPRSH